MRERSFTWQNSSAILSPNSQPSRISDRNDEMYANLTSSSRTDSPVLNIIRVRPDQIAEGAFMRDFLGSRNYSNLIQCSDLRTQTAMNTQHRAINDGTQSHEIEHLTASLPHRCIPIFLKALLVEPIDLCDLTRFVVPTDQGYPIRVSRGVNTISNRSSKETYLAFKHNNRVNVSKLKYPLST